MANRELTMEDYLAMVRRRLKVVLIPVLVAPLTGLLVSYYTPLFPPRYTSQALVLVEGQKLPDNMVQPVITSDFSQRIATMQQQVLAGTRLRPVAERLEQSGLIKAGESAKTIANIRTYLQLQPVISSMTAAAASSSDPKVRRKAASGAMSPGFYVNYSDSDPRLAQRICNEMASLLTTVNQESRTEVSTGATAFLGRQVDDAKRALDDQDAKLATFKNKYSGQLPGDEDNNLRVLMSLNSQFDATTAALNRAQQDKTYTESLLAQQLAAWRSSQSSTNPETLEQQLNVLQTQLLQLQGRYTDDHPDVIKAKNDIAEVKKKLAEVNAAASKPAEPTEKANAAEPAEIRQMRLQIHQYDNVIAQATAEQKKLQNQIQLYQSRTAMSPGIEEQYKALTRDYDNLQATYRDLLAKKSSAELATNMENQQQGEQMNVLIPAGLPTDPSFPVHPIFAAAGLGAALALSLAIAVFLEFRDNSIRTEKDASAAMDLPLLVSVPWVGEQPEDEVIAYNGNGNGKARRSFWTRSNGNDKNAREKVEV